jgi:hypothetical protein
MHLADHLEPTENKLVLLKSVGRKAPEWCISATPGGALMYKMSAKYTQKVVVLDWWRS